MSRMLNCKHTKPQQRHFLSLSVYDRAPPKRQALESWKGLRGCTRVTHTLLRVNSTVLLCSRCCTDDASVIGHCHLSLVTRKKPLTLKENSRELRLMQCLLRAGGGFGTVLHSRATHWNLCCTQECPEKLNLKFEIIE